MVDKIRGGSKGEPHSNGQLEWVTFETNFSVWGEGHNNIYNDDDFNKKAYNKESKKTMHFTLIELTKANSWIGNLIAWFAISSVLIPFQ